MTLTTTRHSCRLYAISPPAIDPDAFAEPLAAALDAGDVGCFQLRLKDVPDDDIRRAVDRLMPVTRARDVAFVLNDRPDIAAKHGCDGVHVGQEDTPYEEARALVGADAIVGISANDSRHLAMEGADKGADYVAFGAFFPSPTKANAEGRAGVDLLQWWSEIMEVPVVAIGGITQENCRPLVRAGADFICSISAIWAHPDGPAAAVRAFDAAFRQALAEGPLPPEGEA